MTNSARLSLHIPEPKVRPGDKPDFSDLKIPEAGSVPRPDIAVRAKELAAYADTLIRVLDDKGKAVGPWNPQLDPETLRRGLRAMMLTRAYDDRMFRAQRQGKTSFYMKCTGEEAVAVAQAMALRIRRHVLSDLSPAGPADRARLSAGRHDVPGLFECRATAEGPADAGHVFEQASRASSPFPAISARSSARRWAGRWRRPTRATTASRRRGSAKARPPKAISTTR